MSNPIDFPKPEVEFTNAVKVNEAVTPVTPMPVPDVHIPVETVTAVSEDDNIPVIDDTLDTHTKEPDDVVVTTSKHQNIKIEFPLDNPVKLEAGDQIVLPSTDIETTKRILEELPQVDLTSDPKTRDWISTVAEGSEFTVSDNIFTKTLEDPEAEFSNKVTHNNLNLNAGFPKLKSPENENLKGERAVIQIISHLGLGSMFQVPLYHSGFWITFKPPSESELIELNRIIMADKIKLGRHTYGLVFSNTTVYTIRRLIDFALAHVYDTTLKDVDVANLRDHIKTQDINVLLWGFICTMYPKGFKYKRACMNNPAQCQHVIEDTLNVTKLQWTNTSALTDWQRTHMTSRNNKVKESSTLKRYSEDLSRTQKRKVTIDSGTDTIDIVLKSPSSNEYIENGYAWISSIVDIVDRTLGSDASDEERNKLITRYGQSSMMRQYSHWVDSIEWHTNVIDDRETIDQTLDRLSTDDYIRNTFIDAVIDYINGSTMSVIGIPTFDCPKCKMPQELPGIDNELKAVIPIDVVTVFFALLTQRLQRMIER